MTESESLVPRIHIVGRKNSGKTTLVCELVDELTRRGLRVATVKHTHHNHELDTPGKDSHRHREAGAAGVGILSPQMTAAFVPGLREAEDGYATFQTMFADCDMILVEGDLQTQAVRLEVWRSAVSECPYALETSGIAAVITDDEVVTDARLCQRTPLRGVADLVMELARV